MENEKCLLQISQLEKDIDEIEKFFTKPFDRQEAIRIIQKHHFTDMNVAIADFILNCNANTLSFESPYKINTYIGIIEIYLTSKLEKLRKTRGN